MRKLALFSISVTIFIIILEPSIFSLTAPDSVKGLFWKANAAYFEQRYQNAVMIYEKLLSLGYESGDVYYNLGNAYFRIGRLGKALVNYERARYFIPRDPDLRFNIKQIEENREDFFENKNTLWDGLLSCLYFFSLRELYWSFVFVNFLTWLVFLLRAILSHKFVRSLARVLALLWLCCGITLAFKLHKTRYDNRAVVIVDEANVTEGPHSKDRLLFTLHDGSIVTVEKSYSNWKVIRLPNGKKGWIDANMIEEVRKFNAP